MSSRIEREREFHNDRFTDSPVRSKQLRGMTSAITLRALNATYNRIERYSKDSVVLDYGCAQGETSFILHRHGAKSISGIDISDVAIERAKIQAENKGVNNVDFQVMNAEVLDFEDNSFDLVCGFGIIHHLDITKSISEIARVLKPSGRAVFLEPLGHNLAINAFRNLTPSLRTPDEHPLLMSDLQTMAGYFTEFDAEFLNLATLATMPLRRFSFADGLERACAKLDKSIFTTIPPLRRYAWNVVLDYGVPKADQEPLAA
ncbi:MAG: class I SAM-dependent methyltransferase [Pseudomonadota bacterium]